MYWVHLPGKGIESSGYVGITKRLVARWRNHRSKYSCCKIFKSAIKKYGDALEWDCIFTGSQEDALSLENFYRPKPCIGWNLNVGGDVPGFYGRKHSEESKQKQRDASKACNNPRSKLMDVYRYEDNSLVASGVYLVEWARENDNFAAELYKSSRADRSKPHHWKTNKYHCKGYYAKEAKEQKYD